MTEYLVPYESAESEFEEKRSRFISHVFLVESEAEARARIDEMKKKYYDARHNCWCFVLHDGTVRYGDDGEPQGTAGQPMLNVFQRENVENVVCIVTRYFGGILLGTGGLVRAYQGSAQLGLEKVPTRAREVLIRCLVSMDTAHDGIFQNLLRAARGQIVTSDYRFDASYEILVPEPEVEGLESGLARATAGEALFERLEEEAV